jgi:hypothetical protein
MSERPLGRIPLTHVIRAVIKRWLPRRDLQLNVEFRTAVGGIPNIHKVFTSSEVRYSSLERRNFDIGNQRPGLEQATFHAELITSNK